MCHPRGTTPSLVVGQAGVSTWKLPGATPPPSTPFLLPQTRLRSLVILALLPPNYSIVTQFNRLRMLPPTPPPCPSSSGSTSPKPRCPSLSLNPFFTVVFLLSLCVERFTSAHPKQPSLFSPLHSYSYLPMALFRRWLPARLVAGPPRLLHWIGTPSRLHLPSPIVV